MRRYNISDKSKSTNFPFYIDVGVHKRTVEPHTHSYTELTVILGGSAVHIVDGEQYDIKAGDVFVINGDTFHGYSDVHSLKLCNIMFEFNKMIEYDTGLKKLPGFQSLFILEPYYRKEHKFESKLELNTDMLKFVEDMIYILLQEFEEKREGFESVIRAYFISLAGYLSRKYTAGQKTSSQKMFHLANAITFIENNYTSQIKNSQVAAMAYLSERHFIRIFKQFFKVTPTEYLILHRLEHACRLMNSTELTMTQIALESGFNDVAYFSRIFKARFGLSPKEFRKTIFKLKD